MSDMKPIRYLIALARNELGVVPCDDASAALDRIEAEVERLQNECNGHLQENKVLRRRAREAEAEIERLRAVVGLLPKTVERKVSDE